MYRHQYDAITRVIWTGEKLGKWESLLDIVTGGGKTVIMAGLIAYFWQVRGCEKFVILTPNTIVRERVKDDFDLRNPAFAYREFPFFFNSHRSVPDRLVCKVLRDGGDAGDIRDASVIVANIHQLYEGRQSPGLEVLLSEAIPDLVVLNDEAHNAAAAEYREVLKLLRRKTLARVDLTATPFRLDKQDLDTYPPVFEYHVQQAMRDGVVKQIVVTKPDIEREAPIRGVGRERPDHPYVRCGRNALGANRTRAGGAGVRCASSPQRNARRQQLQIAQSTFDYQRKCVPCGVDGKPAWEPLAVDRPFRKDAWLIFETLQKEPFKRQREELLLA